MEELSVNNEELVSLKSEIERDFPESCEQDYEELLSDVRYIRKEEDPYVQHVRFWSPFNNGDYQKRLEDAFYRSRLTDLSGFPQENQAVNLAEEIQKYAQDLVDQGVNPVRIVDMGATSAKTICQSARLLENEIKEGKVEVTATNYATKPKVDDISDLEDYLGENETQDFKYALENNLVNFTNDSTLTLYEKFKNYPAHLLFLVGNPMMTKLEITSAPRLTAQLLAKLIDPDKGTMIIGFEGRADDRDNTRVGGILSESLAERGILESPGWKRFLGGLVPYRAKLAPEFRLTRPIGIVKEEENVEASAEPVRYSPWKKMLSLIRRENL